MRKLNRLPKGGWRCGTAIVGLCFLTGGFADQLKVTIPDVSGAEQISQGQFAAGIARMEQQPATLKDDQRGALLIALCGAYTLVREFEKADPVCDRAVGQPYFRAMAYNNRGVLRAHQGDYDGARQDFKQAQAAPLRNSYQDVRLKQATRRIVTRNAAYSQELWAAALQESESSVADTN